MNPRTVPLRAGWTISQEHVRLSASRPVRVQNLKVNHEVGPHDHAFYEIVVIRAGTAIHQTDYYDLPIRPGSVVVIPPGKVHAITRTRQLQVTNIYYLAEWLLGDLRALWENDGVGPLFLAASLFRRPELLKVPQFELGGDSPACSRELDDTAAELERSAPSIVYLRSSFSKFLILLSRAYMRSAAREVGFQFRREIWMALEHIEDCIADCRPLRVDELARKLNMSPDHFSKLFKKASGWAPLEYFQSRRIQHACRLLLNPQTSITEVGYALGYADTAHLSRLFKRFMSVSPRAYRATYLSELPYFKDAAKGGAKTAKTTGRRGDGETGRRGDGVTG